MGTGNQSGNVKLGSTGSRLPPPNHVVSEAAVASTPLSKGGDEIDNPWSRGEDKGSSGEMTLGILQQRWNDLLTALKPKNHSVQALLRSARPKMADSNRAV